MKTQLIVYPQSLTATSPYPLKGEEFLDLYKDEPIPLVLSMDEYTNVAEKSSSYSKSFEIPGTKKNNLFFNHIHDVTADTDFNPHKKTRCKIKEGSIDIFNGYLQLNDIIHVGKNISYEITIFSTSITIKDILSNKSFRDLDLSELDHIYNEEIIIDSWTYPGNLGVLLSTVLPAGTFAGTPGSDRSDIVKYPLCLWNNEYVHQVGGTAPTLSANTGATSFNDFFRPWVQAYYLFMRIFSEAGYSFTSTFLNSSTFTKQYVDFNDAHGSTNFSIFSDEPNLAQTFGNTMDTIDYTAASATVGIDGELYVDTGTYDNLVSPGTYYFSFAGFVIFSCSGSQDISIRTKHNGVTQSTYYATVTNGQQVNIPNPGLLYCAPGDTMSVKIRCTSGTVQLLPGSHTEYRSYSGNTGTGHTKLNRVLAGARGDISQWDFVKSFITKYNLLFLQDEDNENNIIIEPWKDWVDTGNILDWTSKADEEEKRLTPIDGLARRLIFQKKEDESDYITKNLNSPNSWLFSHTRFNIDVEIFDVVEEIIEVNGISSTYMDRPFDSHLRCPIIQDEGLNEKWDNGMRCLFDNGVVIFPYPGGPTPANWNIAYESIWAGSSFGFWNYSGGLPAGLTSHQYSCPLFSPVEDYPVVATSESNDFGMMQYNHDTSSYTTIINTLYNLYWSKYIDELYSKNTRIVTMKIKLLSADISAFRFNDVVRIKNKIYRVLKIEYKAGDISTIELVTIKDL
jgi:hypothetical protein